MMWVIAKFEPKEDITAFELAYVLKRVSIGLGSSMNGGVHFSPEQWEGLPPGVRRHFEVEPE
jgi:hypothetical protein